MAKTSKKTKEYKPSKFRLGFESLLAKSRLIPIPVWIIFSTICNYCFGLSMARINELFSNISDYTNRIVFTTTLVKMILMWVCIRLLNQCIGKIEKHCMLNRNYMKWITRLTTSKLSSISTVSTGAANNAIHTISSCDKGMVESALGVIPNVVPFIMLCIKEYGAAGIKPTAINVGCMVAYIVYATAISKSQSYKRQAKARAEMSSVTIDCIKNSQTVKYFNKEHWSLGKQESTQIATFGRHLAMPANISTILFYTVMWIPTVAAVYYCWEDRATVLYVIMMSYVIDNIGCYISNFMDNYTEKRNQLDILGKLEPDNTKKLTLPDVLEIRDVEFKYDQDNEDSVLFKIDHLDIVKGHRYCVTGKSGFGKSTLAKLLSGTFKPIKGEIPDIESVYMFAESEMFNTTIAENITLGDSYDTKEINDILNAFEVEVDLDVFKDSVGEGGNSLSTGQRQRINLARTLFYARRHPGSLIVMDEVTAALDIKTSITCLEYLTSEFKRLGVTLIYISNKTDYQEVDLITDNIYVDRNNKVVTYTTD